MKKHTRIAAICLLLVTNVYADVDDPNTAKGATEYDWQSCLTARSSECLNGCATSTDINCNETCSDTAKAKCTEEGFTPPPY